MSLTLKRFSQDVDISDKDNILYYLVMADEKGKEIRLKITEEATHELIQFIYGQVEAPAESPPPDDDDNTEIFPPENPQDAYYDGEQDNGSTEHTQMPRSEEEVPSI